MFIKILSQNLWWFNKKLYLCIRFSKQAGSQKQDEESE